MIKWVDYLQALVNGSPADFFHSESVEVMVLGWILVFRQLNSIESSNTRNQVHRRRGIIRHYLQTLQTN